MLLAAWVYEYFSIEEVQMFKYFITTKNKLVPFIKRIDDLFHYLSFSLTVSNIYFFLILSSDD